MPIRFTLAGFAAMAVLAGVPEVIDQLSAHIDGLPAADDDVLNTALPSLALTGDVAASSLDELVLSVDATKALRSLATDGVAWSLAIGSDVEHLSGVVLVPTSPNSCQVLEVVPLGVVEMTPFEVGVITMAVELIDSARLDLGPPAGAGWFACAGLRDAELQGDVILLGTGPAYQRLVKGEPVEGDRDVLERWVHDTMSTSI